MLNILIVDDEQIVRIYLQSVINWQEEGCKVVGVCKNGAEALAFLKNNQVDVVLTDLKMPKMNGIELMAEMKARNMETKVIVLSNHSDYDLVRQAMKLGAMDYFIKINLRTEDLINLIKQIKVELNEKQLKKRKLEEDEKNEVHHFKIGRKSFLTTVLKGDIYYSEDELDRYVKMYHLFEPQLSLYRLRVKENDKIEDDQFPYIDAIIREQFRGFDFDVVHINHEKVLIILYEREVLEDLIITDRWIKVVRSVRNYLNTDLQASKRVVIDSRVKLAACTKLFQDQVRPDQQISLISDEELAHYRPEVQLVLAYIHEHYVERITLQELADYACLNEAYLSRIFKIETHKTLNNYLNELRISKAKKLLKKRDIKVKEVAQLVGIKDQLYFNRVFKKFCGENPTEYQERVKKVHF